MSFRLVTDSTADLNEDWAKEHGVDILGLTVELEGQVYETVGPDRLESSYLLERMKKGAQPLTSQINVGQFQEYFNSQVEAGQAVLYIGFSSVLSGTFQSAVIARDLVLESHPDAQIELIDTRAAAAGEGFLVLKAQELRAAGQSLEETSRLIQDLAPRLRTYFLVNDLYHLVRGGRLSKTSALVGSLVNIKPLLWIDADGNLAPLAKLRGKKKAKKEMLLQATRDVAEPRAILSYSNDKKAAEKMRKKLLESGCFEEVLLYPLGPVISAHIGPNSLVLYVIGQEPR